MKTPRARRSWNRNIAVRHSDRNRYRCAPRFEAMEARSLLSVLTVTSNADSGPGTLRAEVGAAQSGDVVTFAPSLDGDTITLTSGEIIPPNSVTIEGPGANLLAISGNHASRIFNVPYGESLSVSGLTLENGQSLTGGAIFSPDPTQSLSVSDCTFTDNVAISDSSTFLDALGGAIASNSSVTIDGSSFNGNRAVAANGATSPVAAAGGAIWVNGANLQVTNSHFLGNSAVGGTGTVGGPAEGGAIYYRTTSANANGNSSTTISVTGSSFVFNTALAGSADARDAGGNAIGGAIDIEAFDAESPKATVSNNHFDFNLAVAGAGAVGGLAEGGALTMNAAEAFTPVFHADDNQFNYSLAIGGASTFATTDSDFTGHGGAAYGGAVAYLTEGTGPTFTFNGDHVTAALADGGSAAQLGLGAADATGGDARGGGLYVDATNSDFGQVAVDGSTFNIGRAIGGSGGDRGLNGLTGGDASGGGIAAVIAGSRVLTPEAGTTFTIDRTTVTNSSATGGAGGDGIQPSSAAGGTGGNGGNSFGGGISLDPGSSVAAVFNLTNDHLGTDVATGGRGGNGASGAHGFKGGNGGSGGGGSGGGLAVTLGINGYANEGNGAAKLLRVNVANSMFLVNQAIGGAGGGAGNGLIAGFAGGGGNALGGGISLRGLVSDPTNLVALNTDFLFANTARGGNGGLGGISIAVPGGAGGNGGTAFGGGIDILLKGGTQIFNSTILGNHAIGGSGGAGGSGLGGHGPNGQNGVGIGGGVRVAPVAGISAGADVNTVIIANSADIGPDIDGTLGVI